MDLDIKEYNYEKYKTMIDQGNKGKKSNYLKQ